jgi:quinol monooxygenase YgiN
MSAENEVVVVYRAIATTEFRETVKDAFASIALATHAEPGCLGWAIHQGIDDENEFIEVSRWTTAEDSSAHGSTEHVQWILGVFGGEGVLQQPGVLSVTRALGLGTVEKGYLSNGR